MYLSLVIGHTAIRRGAHLRLSPLQFTRQRRTACKGEGPAHQVATAAAQSKTDFEIHCLILSQNIPFFLLPGVFRLGVAFRLFRAFL